MADPPQWSPLLVVCGVVWWVASPLSVVCGPGVGLLVVVPALPPCDMVRVRVFLRWLPPASLGLLWVFGILLPMMIMLMMGAMITIFIINSNILMFLWLVVGCLLPTRRVNDSRFIDRRATIFVKVASCHRDLACRGTRSS